MSISKQIKSRSENNEPWLSQDVFLLNGSGTVIDAGSTPGTIYYKQIGKTVHFTLKFNSAALAANGSGTRLINLPLPTAPSHKTSIVGSGYSSSGGSVVMNLVVFTGASANQIFFSGTNSTTGVQIHDASNFPVNGGAWQILAQGTYETI